MKVCEKVQRKGTTSYNEVADELVSEFTNSNSHLATDAVSKYVLKFVVTLQNCLVYHGILSLLFLHCPATLHTFLHLLHYFPNIKTYPLNFKNIELK